jgi:hypothetical protein
VGPELIILIIALVVVLAWRGPSSLPRLGEALGKAVKGARESMPGGSRATPGEGTGPGSPDASGAGTEPGVDDATGTETRA